MALDNAASAGGAAVAAVENDPDTAHPSLTGRQQFWLDHIRRCDAGRIATKAYAEQNNLSIHAMYSARKDLVVRGVPRAGGRGVANPSFARFARVTTKQEPSSVPAVATTWRIELNRLRRDNKRLREERAILSKAAAWFARETNAIPTGSSSSSK